MVGRNGEGTHLASPCIHLTYHVIDLIGDI